MKPRIKFLDDHLVQRIIREAYKLLRTKGINLNHDTLLKRFAEIGCRVDMDNKRVYFPAEIIARSVESAPKRLRLWNIAGTDYIDMAGDNVHFAPGSAAIKILDYYTNRMRPATTEDMLRYCRVVEQLEEIDCSATAIVPADAPAYIGDSLRLYALLKTTTKPIVTGAFTTHGFEVMSDLQLAVRGTREALRERPFAIFSCCPTSPLKWSRITADNAMRCAELGIPVEFVAMPLSGLVAPISLIGCVIQHTAETLSGIVISQMTRPGAPVLYGGSPGIFDMRTMAATICSVEAQMIACACAEVGKFLQLPTQAYAGMSDSKFLDGQAGFETATGAYLATLARVNSVSGPGMLYFESCQSLEKLVFDAEICGMARRLVIGMETGEDFPYEDVFEQLLQEGNLLTSENTLKRYKREHYIPGSAVDRSQVQDEMKSYPGLRQRMHAEVQRYLAEYRAPNVLSDDQIRNIDGVMAAAAGDYELGF